MYFEIQLDEVRRLRRAATLTRQLVAGLDAEHPAARIQDFMEQQLAEEQQHLERVHEAHAWTRHLDAAHYRSLSHRHVSSLLSSRKARIYGMM